jgi:hypothetical protein
MYIGYGVHNQCETGKVWQVEVQWNQMAFYHSGGKTLICYKEGVVYWDEELQLPLRIVFSLVS